MQANQIRAQSNTAATLYENEVSGIDQTVDETVERAYALMAKSEADWKRADAEGTGDVTVAPEDVDETRPKGNLTWLWITLGVVGAVGAGVLVWLKKIKSGKNSELIPGY